MIVKAADDLRKLVEKILLKAGADDQNANQVAEHLVRANLSSVDSHGVWHVLGYVKMIQDGELVPDAQPQVHRETSNSALVTGNWTFGQVAARLAIETAIEKARSQNMAIVGLVRTNHIGRLGHYAEMAAKEGMISMICLGGQGTKEPTAVPFGGREKLIHTNPIAMGFPAEGEDPAMMFDFATTAVAGVKVINAERRNEKLPPGCLVDEDGRPSTDPSVYFHGGGHVPFGGHKGYAIMMAIEYLGRIFLGSETYAQPPLGFKYDRYGGTFMLTFKADLFQPFRDYAGLAEDVARQTRAIPPAPDFEEVLLPGDLEARSRKIRQESGIPIEDDVWQTIVQAAERVGVRAV